MAATYTVHADDDRSAYCERENKIVGIISGHYVRTTSHIKGSNPPASATPFFLIQKTNEDDPDRNIIIKALLDYIIINSKAFAFMIGAKADSPLEKLYIEYGFTPSIGTASTLVYTDLKKYEEAKKKEATKESYTDRKMREFMEARAANGMHAL